MDEKDKTFAMRHGTVPERKRARGDRDKISVTAQMRMMLQKATVRKRDDGEFEVIWQKGMVRELTLPEELALQQILRALRSGQDWERVMERLEGKVTQPVASDIQQKVTFQIGKGYVNRDDE